MPLFLHRIPGQAIRIGDRILVRVCRIEQGRVELAIEAPADVEIWREEIPFDDEPAPVA